MLSKSIFYQLFLISVLFSTFLGYFSGSGLVTYSPLILLMISIIIIELGYMEPMKSKDWLAIFIWFPYLVWAGYYYILNPYEDNYLTTYLLIIITLPFVILSFIRLRNNISFNYVDFIYKLILSFLIAQVLICIGQISTYVLGFGFSVSEEQEMYLMVPGTFTNSNDLGATVLLLSFILISLEKYLLDRKVFIWCLIVILLLVSGSRSALLLTSLLFIFTRGLSTKDIITYSIFLILAYIPLSFLLNSSNELFVNFSNRIQSLLIILEGGIGVDNSATLRLKSYIYFLENIFNLGFGSGKLNDYFKYSYNANFETELVFQNPHSLIVEIGYWLGIPGLISFAVASLYLFRYSERKLLLFGVISISTLIPSSIIGSLVYFLLMVCAFFVAPRTEYKSQKKFYYSKLECGNNSLGLDNKGVL